MNQAEARDYFNAYAQAFIRDATVAADRFLHIPLTIVEREKTVALTSTNALMENFERINDINEQLGLAEAEITRCDLIETKAANVIEAVIGWRFLNGEREMIYGFETRYLICDYGDGWKICVAVNVDD